MNALTEQYAIEVDMDNKPVETPFPYRLDWFEGTTHAFSAEEVMEVIGGEWAETRTHQRYERGCTNGAVTIMWSPLRDARALRSSNENDRPIGVRIEVPGHADPTQYYNKLVRLQVAPFRFDIAFDTDQFEVDYIWEAWLSGRVQTLAVPSKPGQPKRKGMSGIHAINGDTGRLQTCYFNTTERQVCCYNKAAEQGLDGTWTRIEYRFRGQTAKKVWGDMGNLIKHCHKSMRVMKRKYAQMNLGKLDNNFAAVVRRAGKTSENHYRFQVPAICPNLALERSRRHLKRLLSWIKTHICTDPQMLAELVNTSVKPDLCARIIHDLKRTNSEATDWASSFARHMQGSRLATTLTS